MTLTEYKNVRKSEIWTLGQGEVFNLLDESLELYECEKQRADDYEAVLEKIIQLDCYGCTASKSRKRCTDCVDYNVCPTGIAKDALKKHKDGE